MRYREREFLLLRKSAANRGNGRANGRSVKRKDGFTWTKVSHCGLHSHLQFSVEN